MNKEFVPYTTALSLKELGFDEPCLGRYCIVKEGEEKAGEILFQNTDCLLFDNNLVKAPLYQQIYKWFRQKHKLFCEIHVGTFVKVGLEEYFWVIYGEYKNSWIMSLYDCNSQPYKTYEEAEIACIDKLIEIVKNKRQNK